MVGGEMFNTVTPESRVPNNHPLRPIRKIVDQILQELSPLFDGLYASEGRPSIPPERLLLETDGPYLLPRTLRPKPASRRNEPAYLPQIAGAVARARGETLESLARSSTTAARALFQLPGDPAEPRREG